MPGLLLCKRSGVRGCPTPAPCVLGNGALQCRAHSGARHGREQGSKSPSSTPLHERSFWGQNSRLQTPPPCTSHPGVRPGAAAGSAARGLRGGAPAATTSPIRPLRRRRRAGKKAGEEPAGGGGALRERLSPAAAARGGDAAVRAALSGGRRGGPRLPGAPPAATSGPGSAMGRPH